MLGQYQRHVVTVFDSVFHSCLSCSSERSQAFLFPCTTTFGLRKGCFLFALVAAYLEASGVCDGGLTVDCSLLAIFAAVALFFPLRWRLRDADVDRASELLEPLPR